MLEAHKAAVRRLYDEVFTAGQLAVVGDILVPDYVGYDPPDAAPSRRGPAALVEGAARLRDAFPDRTFTVEDLIAEGDLVAARVTLTGTHNGPFFDTAPTGRRIAVTGTVTYRFVGGKIAASWGNWDNLGLLRQLGLLPVEGRPAKADQAGGQ